MEHPSIQDRLIQEETEEASSRAQKGRHAEREGRKGEQRKGRSLAQVQRELGCEEERRTAEATSHKEDHH